MKTITEQKILDRRQKKTRAAIQNALLALMKEKPMEKITVSELAARADVNRKTFYNHYSNIFQVRQELDQQYIDGFLKILEEAPNEAIRANPVYFIECLIENMTKAPEQTRLIFDSGEHLYLAQRFKELALPSLTEVVQRSCRHPEYLPHVTEYMVSGLVTLLDRWVHSEEPEDPTEFAHLTADLLTSSTHILGLSGE